MKTGDFVSSYSAGYWQIVDIKPQIADSDFNDDNSMWKKGDVIGQWVILKKCFTSKMKPRIDFEYVDSVWVSPLPKEVVADINRFFLEHPDYKEKFENAPIKIQPTITNCWLDLPTEKEEEFKELLLKMPQEFTIDDFWKRAKKYKKFISDPPSRYLLNFMCYPWSLDRKANIIYHRAELIKNQ